MTKTTVNRDEITKELNEIVGNVYSTKLYKVILKESLNIGIDVKHQAQKSVIKVEKQDTFINDLKITISNRNQNIKKLSSNLLDNCNERSNNLNSVFHSVSSILKEDIAYVYKQFEPIIKNINNDSKFIFSYLARITNDISSKYDLDKKDYLLNSKKTIERLNIINIETNRLQRHYNEINNDIDKLEKCITYISNRDKIEGIKSTLEVKSLISNLNNGRLKNINEVANNFEEFYTPEYDSVDKKLNDIVLILKAFCNPSSQKYKILSLKKQAKLGDSQKQYELGRLYEYQLENLTEAFKWYLQSANNNYVQAQIEVGDCYLAAYGTNKDVSRAIDYYSKASNNNSISAKLKLATLYENGAEVEQNFEKALNLFLEGAKLDNTECQFRAGNYYYQGIGAKKDLDNAILWLNKSAYKGCCNSEKLLCKIDTEIELINRANEIQKNIENLKGLLYKIVNKVFSK